MKRSFAPIIAAVLLLLPVLYVGSYLALVAPGGQFVAAPNGPDGFYVEERNGRWKIITGRYRRYTLADEWSRVVFWPLEQIDQRVRRGAWLRKAELVP
jgi:hypothetical protein